MPSGRGVGDGVAVGVGEAIGGSVKEGNGRGVGSGAIVGRGTGLPNGDGDGSGAGVGRFDWAAAGEIDIASKAKKIRQTVNVPFCICFNVGWDM